LRAVARRKDDRLAQLLGERRRLLPVERDPLAQLDRRVMVRGADEDEMHQAKWVAGRARRTTITSKKPASARYAARLPASPRTRRTRYEAQTNHVTQVAITSASRESPRLISRPMPTPIP